MKTWTVPQSLLAACFYHDVGFCHLMFAVRALWRTCQLRRGLSFTAGWKVLAMVMLPLKHVQSWFMGCGFWEVHKNERPIFPGQRGPVFTSVARRSSSEISFCCLPDRQLLQIHPGFSVRLALWSRWSSTRVIGSGRGNGPQSLTSTETEMGFLENK